MGLATPTRVGSKALAPPKTLIKCGRDQTPVGVAIREKPISTPPKLVPTPTFCTSLLHFCRSTPTFGTRLLGPSTSLCRRKSLWADFELGKMSLKRFLNFGSKIDRPKMGVAGKALQIRNPQAIAVHIDTGYQS